MDTDRMFCHACGGVWLKDGNLACPHCASEFTEIKYPPKVPHHTVPTALHRLHMPAHGEITTRGKKKRHMNGKAQAYSEVAPLHTHPCAHTDPPDGRFSFSSATLDTGMPSGQRNNGPNPMVPMMMQSFDTILQSLMEPNPRGYRGFGEDPFHPQSSTSPDWLEDDHLAGHHPGLGPRNADAPQSINRNPMTITEFVFRIMDAIRADIGAQTTRRARGTRGPAGPNPLSILSAILNMDRSGDAVYSQEELDRVITQLVENTGGASTAAPPASDNAIQSLPKKKVDREMMGVEGNAECSICMDSVELGTEVTVLPCTHWFHFACIEAWLTQHNTCPHCRRGIASNIGSGDGTCENPLVIQDSPEQPTSRRRRSSALTTRSGRSSFSSMQISRSPEQATSGSSTRQPSRSEGSGGGFANWFANRFGSST
ncbi:hypothetical protein N7457_008254 [Penicillium paradoxum]|uniref:uncharacterized protein n=1 Tax=Penicillium paradoxum TaxID=176176 RepID=UPI00254767C1|nr:uncharacterized protein N7457_008254 [Penicillium paradoxum]KAJ5773358.1 hypothetical protein N7457_008254 [Penicillium paradoxum]